jgi:peptidoglycan-associated lipoprotein
MRKSLLLVALLLLVSGCSCRTKKMGDGDGSGDNIPIAASGNELKDIYFAFDQYNITPSAQSTLRENAEWLRANPNAKVQVEGHCDERGTNEYNMVLGANRARATMEYLRSLGIDAGRMSTVSYGEELPLDTRHVEEAWAKNRRAHFNIVSR